MEFILQSKGSLATKSLTTTVLFCPALSCPRMYSQLKASAINANSLVIPEITNQLRWVSAKLSASVLYIVALHPGSVTLHQCLHHFCVGFVINPEHCWKISKKQGKYARNIPCDVHHQHQPTNQHQNYEPDHKYFLSYDHFHQPVLEIITVHLLFSHCICQCNILLG